MLYLTSPILQYHSNILHAFTTRHGGQSALAYACNNLAFHVGDNTRTVLSNHEHLARQLGYNRASLVHMRQIHSNRVVRVDRSFDFSTPPECDALITDEPDLPLMVMVADCTPILLYDPVAKAVAVIHAGRAGAFKKIVNETVIAMHAAFGSRASDLIAVLGPAICATCYEINETIFEEARRAGTAQEVIRSDGRYFLDIRAVLERQLKASGIKPEKIDHIRQCSSCEHEHFFSYRADGGTTGRMAGVIMLRH
jgi:YfiH family protein